MILNKNELEEDENYYYFYDVVSIYSNDDIIRYNYSYFGINELLTNPLNKKHSKLDLLIKSHIYNINHITFLKVQFRKSDIKNHDSKICGTFTPIPAKEIKKLMMVL